MSTTAANIRCTPTGATPRVADLLPRASDGDPGAWEEIVRRYGGLVSATVRSFRLQDNDALDAVQMTWLRLAENAHRVQFPERLGAWLVTTARRECLRILRDRAKLASAPLDIDTVADSSVGPEQHVIDMDTAQMLRDLVAELEPRKRNLLQALFTDNPQPYAEIARATGIPIGSIGPTRARALRRLRRLGNDEHGLGEAASAVGARVC
jgi:RNA polymerase sigma factor (sigma-70 family)